jgi:hypothetical protein
MMPNLFNSKNGTLVSGFTSILAACLIFGGCSSEPVPNSSSSSPAAATPSSPKPHVLPAEFFLKPVVERGKDGEIYISGTTNLPDGMKMWVTLGSKKAQQDAFVSGGQFRSGALYQNVPIPITGSQPLGFTAYFNRNWQSKEMLALVGEGGKNLHGNLFKLTDPDVIDSERMLVAKFTVSMPPISQDTNAINIVKHAILTVPGNGKSATDIEENLALFTKPGTGVTVAKGWSAASTGTSMFNVSYDFIDGGSGEKQAIWSVNIATKQVKYVNEAAKLFSWTPAY